MLDQAQVRMKKTQNCMQKQIQELTCEAFRCTRKGDRLNEGRAYCNLGIAYHRLGQFEKAAEFHRKHLNIALEVGDRAIEGGAYGNLGNAYNSLGQFEKAVEFYLKRLNIALEVGDIRVLVKARCLWQLRKCLTYNSLGQFEKAAEFHRKDLNIALEVGDRAGEGSAYGNLGNAYHRLGQLV